MKQVDPYHLTAGFLECGEMHAFVEPHLSLDAPMRENYRPDMAFHAADGWERAGSDGELRLPPMTFTPIMNGPQVERQAVPAVARSNVYLGLVGANMVHIHMYVYNQLNEIRKQNTAMVDQIFAELGHLSSSILTSHDAVHPAAQVVPLGPDSDNIRTRAWRRNDGCIHVVVVNVPPEGGPPSPANFKVQLTGLTAAEAKTGLTPLFDGCVVSFVAPKNQTYVCRHLELTHHTDGVKHHPELVAADSFSDYIGPAATNVYRIGCREGAVDEEEANILAPATNNLVPDPSFEDSQQPGTPAYNLHSHQAYWHLVLGSNDANPRFDDASWLHIDGRLPYSGLRSGRVFLPEGGQPVAVTVPCDDGAGGQSKICAGGAFAMTNLTLTMSMQVRVGLAGGKISVVTGPLSALGPVTQSALTTVVTIEPKPAKWTAMTGTISSSIYDGGSSRQRQVPPPTPPPVLALLFEVPRAASIWIDDVHVSVSEGP